MTQELLDGADVPSTALRVNSVIFKEMCGKGVPEYVGRDVFLDTGAAGGAF
jgi:hypothetical protein